MHRTTIPLDSSIEREVRKLAQSERRSFKELVNDLLKRGLAIYKIGKEGKNEFHWQIANPKSKALFDPADRDSYWPEINRKLT